MHKLTRFRATLPALCVLLLFLLSPFAGASASALAAQNPATSAAVGAAAANAPSPSDPALVQQSGAAFGAGVLSLLPVSFPGQVTSGDIVIVGVSLLGNTVTGVTDSLTSTYTLAGSVTGSGGNTYIYYATLHSSGSDTVTVTANNEVEQGGVWIFEVSGATAAGVLTATGQAGSGSGTSTQPFQTSTSVGQSGAFLLALVGTIELLPSPVAGTGFTLSPTQIPESGVVEYSASGATYPSAFPGTYSSSSTVPWGEVGIALAPSSSSSLVSTTTTVGCSPGTVDVGTSTICTGTVAGTGSPAPSGTVTFTDADGTFTPSDVCTLSGANPDRCEVFFTPAAGSEGTQTVSGGYSGDGTYSSSSGSFTALAVDPRTSSTAVSCASPIAAGSSELCTVTVADTDTGTAVTPTGTVTVSDALGVFPSGAGCTLSSGSCTVTFSPSVSQTGSDAVSASYPGDTDHDPSDCGPCTTVDITSAPAGQVAVSITLDQFAGLGSTLSGSNYFVVSYTSSGSPHTSDEVGGTAHLLVDESTTVTISSTSSGSNIFEEWCLSVTGGGCQPTTISVGTSGVSVTYDYFDLQAQVINYGVSGGGSPVAPFFDYSTAPAAPSGSPVADDVSITLQIAPAHTDIWVLAGAVETFESVINTSPSTALTQWAGAPECSNLGGPVGCGTYVSESQIGPFSQGGITVTMEYYLQYSVPASFQLSADAGSGYSTPTLTYYSSYGVQSTLQLGLESPVSVWVSAGSLWSVNGLLGGSGPTQQWVCTGACSGTITSSAQEIDPTYTHQYLVTFGADDLWDCPNAATETVYTCSLTNSSPGATSPSGPTWEDAGAPFAVSQTPPAGTSQGFGLGCGYSLAGDPSTPCYWGTSNAGITFPGGCTHVSGNTCETEFTVNAAGTVLAVFGIPTSSGSAPTCGGGEVYTGTGCVCPDGSVLYGGQCACDGSGCAGLAGWTGVYDPAYILVTAPNGVSQVGCNAGGDLIDTMAGATVSSCAGGTGQFLVADPVPGVYEIQIFPVGASSSYELALSSVALDWDQLGTATLSGTVSSGAPQTVHLTVGADGSLILSSSSTVSPPPPAVTLNSCETGGSCTTAFAVFDVKNASGAEVGGAIVTLSATGLASQNQTTSSAASNSLVCTENPSWTAEWGVYWGCPAGETGQFILTVGVTYTYTVTLQSGTVLTGTFVASDPWDVTIENVTA